MAHWAKPGVKCVCLGLREAGTASAKFGQNVPIRGRVYTVREVRHSGGILGITLVEVVNEAREWSTGYLEAIWSAERFRPLTTTSQEDDVALFRHLLEPTGVNA